MLDFPNEDYNYIKSLQKHFSPILFSLFIGILCFEPDFVHNETLFHHNYL